MVFSSHGICSLVPQNESHLRLQVSREGIDCSGDRLPSRAETMWSNTVDKKSAIWSPMLPVKDNSDGPSSRTARTFHPIAYPDRTYGRKSAAVFWQMNVGPLASLRYSPASR